MFLPQTIAAAAGFLIAVLWFDLMFDVQVLRYRREQDVPETVLDSISAYYHRVTTTASPMGRLVGMVMLALLLALIVQAVRGDAPTWASVVSIAAALVGVGLAGFRGIGAPGDLGGAPIPRICAAKWRAEFCVII